MLAKSSLVQGQAGPAKLSQTEPVLAQLAHNQQYLSLIQVQKKNPNKI